MNYFGYILGRAAAIVLVSLLILVIQMAGSRFSQSRIRAAYEHLGASVSDQSGFRLSWFIWPPHYRLLGRFEGRSFRYEIQKPGVSHIYVDCMPRGDVLYDARPKGRRLPGARPLPAGFPHWMVLVATRQPVPFWKNSADRRPPGFGSRPGIDLHREGAGVFDSVTLREDLEMLSKYCAEPFS